MVTVTATVKEFRWINPHVFLYVTIPNDKGTATEWAFEGRSPTVLRDLGWSRDSLKPGDTVTIDMNPAKNGSRTGIISRIVKADGTILQDTPKY
jgi:Family of unknown function (DUF6152)